MPARVLEDKMDQKVVIITGASAGIGAGIALHLAEVGYNIGI